MQDFGFDPEVPLTDMDEEGVVEVPDTENLLDAQQLYQFTQAMEFLKITDLSDIKPFIQAVEILKSLM